MGQGCCGAGSGVPLGRVVVRLPFKCGKFKSRTRRVDVPRDRVQAPAIAGVEHERLSLWPGLGAPLSLSQA